MTLSTYDFSKQNLARERTFLYSNRISRLKTGRISPDNASANISPGIDSGFMAAETITFVSITAKHIISSLFLPPQFQR